MIKMVKLEKIVELGAADWQSTFQSPRLKGMN